MSGVIVKSDAGCIGHVLSILTDSSVPARGSGGLAGGSAGGRGNGVAAL
jgi:hypothetical protein